MESGEKEIFKSFTNRMAQELDSNIRKGDWTKFKDTEMIKKELIHHVSKLFNVEDDESKLEHSADVANIALFYFNAIKNKENVGDDDWTSLSERRPENGQMVIIWTKNLVDETLSRAQKASYVSRESSSVFIVYPLTFNLRYKSEKNFTGYDSEGDEVVVTHWREEYKKPK